MYRANAEKVRSFGPGPLAAPGAPGGRPGRQRQVDGEDVHPGRQVGGDRPGPRGAGAEPQEALREEETVGEEIALRGAEAVVREEPGVPSVPRVVDQGDEPGDGAVQGGPEGVPPRRTDPGGAEHLREGLVLEAVRLAEEDEQELRSVGLLEELHRPDLLLDGSACAFHEVVQRPGRRGGQVEGPGPQLPLEPPEEVARVAARHPGRSVQHPGEEVAVHGRGGQDRGVHHPDPHPPAAQPVPDRLLGAVGRDGLEAPGRVARGGEPPDVEPAGGGTGEGTVPGGEGDGGVDAGERGGGGGRKPPGQLGEPAPVQRRAQELPAAPVQPEDERPRPGHQASRTVSRL